MDKIKQLISDEFIAHRLKSPSDEVLSKLAEDFICGDDGFYIYWPISGRGGLHSTALRAFANVLDTLNGPWEDELEEYFDNEARIHS